MAKEDKKMTPKDYEKLGKALEEVFLVGYSSPKRLLWFGFLRGIVYGLGIFIGGTIIVAIVISVLTQFNDLPIAGPFIEKIVQIVQGTSAVKL